MPFAARLHRAQLDGAPGCEDASRPHRRAIRLVVLRLLLAADAGDVPAGRVEPAMDVVADAGDGVAEAEPLRPSPDLWPRGAAVDRSGGRGKWRRIIPGTWRINVPGLIVMWLNRS